MRDEREPVPRMSLGNNSAPQVLHLFGLGKEAVAADVEVTIAMYRASAGDAADVGGDSSTTSPS